MLHSAKRIRVAKRPFILACVFSAFMPLGMHLPAHGALETIWPEVESRWTPEERVKARQMLESGALKVTIHDADASPPLGNARHGFLLFVKPYWEPIHFTTVPATADLERPLHLSATPGEREPFSLGVFPLEDGASLRASMDSLKHESGAAIPPSAWRLFLTRSFLVRDRKTKRVSVEPGYLEPANEIPLQSGITRQLWGFLRVPADTEPGIYRGRLRLFREEKEVDSREVTLRVHPFKLRAMPDVDFGWFYSPCISVEQEVASLAEHGCNALNFPAPKVVKVTPDQKVELDFTPLEPVAEACQKYGMNGRHLVYALSIGRRLMKTHKEFSPAFNAAYQDAMRQCIAWAEGKKLKLVAWVVDEPRERDINEWNRNYRDTLAYLDLFKGMEGALTMVSPMRDIQHGKDYTPMMEHMDIVFTHPREESRRFMQLAREQKKPCLAYNSTRDRLSFGLGTWRMGAAGRWQWHYSFGMGKQPFSLEKLLNASDGSFHIVFPTPEGPLATPAYEMTAEGIDDYRYLYTLRARLAETSGETTLQDVRARGQALLEDLANEVPEFTDPKALKRDDEIGSAMPNEMERGALAEKFRGRAAEVLDALSAPEKNR